MEMYSSDGKRAVDIGNSEVWKALYSTIVNSLGLKKGRVKKAIKFIEEGKCKASDGYETARQINIIRDELATVPPQKAIFDLKHKDEKPEWLVQFSPVVTSCANLFTTADGQDLLFEMVSILVYAQVAGSDITVE